MKAPLKTVFEPFRIKMVEPLPILTQEQRLQAVKEAHYNLFRLPASTVTFDFLTDSGTSAMSSAQWAGMMVGDESYAGSRSYEHFENVIQKLTGLKHVIPTHQGRAAESLLFKALVTPGQIIPGNTHFDTTRANIEEMKAQALDLPCIETKNSSSPHPFKGNIDLEALSQLLKKSAKDVPFVILTVTNNSVGGQPVSLANIRAVRELVKSHGLSLFIDAARFAENAYFIKLREEGQQGRSVREIAHDMFACADGVLMSAKKDGFGNIGGFLALKDDSVAEKIRTLMVITEGFPTYGGLAGRDLEALAIGLEEVLDENYLTYRIRSTDYFSKGLEQAGFVTVRPSGGHAVYIDAGATLPHIPLKHFPGQALSVALYEEMGVRSVEVGSVMLGSRDPKTGEEKPAPKELVRLALPRRVYTQSHIDYILEAAESMKSIMPSLPGYEFTYQAPVLRHFTAKFRKLK